MRRRKQTLRLLSPPPEPAPEPEPAADDAMPPVLSIVDLVTPQPLNMAVNLHGGGPHARTTVVRIWDADDARRCCRCSMCHARLMDKDEQFAMCCLNYDGHLTVDQAKAEGVFRPVLVVPSRADPDGRPAFPRLVEA